MPKTKIKTDKASILAYSLIIMAMMIAIAATMSIATVVEKKSASSTDFSVQAYQTADSGVQLAIKQINAKISEGNGTDPISSLFPNCSTATSDGNVFSGADYKLSFFSNKDGLPASAMDCSSGKIKDIRSIKSIGTYKDTLRAVQVAVAADVALSSGAVVAYTTDECPSGWVEADGTNGTPDLRGQFIRGWDHGAGVDPGRDLGSTQEDAFKAHAHSIGIATAPSRGGYTSEGEVKESGSMTTSTVGGTETRPKNIALIYCVYQ
jgi:hypothetical protein